MSFISDIFGGNANDRVDAWARDKEILPGCNPDNRTVIDALDSRDAAKTNPCVWTGTDADWQDYRTNWINNCMTNNSGGFLQSKNKTLRECQDKFDGKAQAIQFGIYAQNAEDLNDIKKLIAGGSPWLYLGGFAAAGVIIYLLLSK